MQAGSQPRRKNCRLVGLLSTAPPGKSRSRLSLQSTNGSDSEDKLNWKDVKDCLKDYRLYLHYVMYTCVGCMVASLSLFAPTIVLGLGYSDMEAQLFTVPPYAIAYVVTIFLAWLSDRWQSRGLLSAVSFTVAGVAFAIQGMQPHRDV